MAKNIYKDMAKEVMETANSSAKEKASKAKPKKVPLGYSDKALAKATMGEFTLDDLRKMADGVNSTGELPTDIPDIPVEAERVKSPSMSAKITETMIETPKMPDELRPDFNSQMSIDKPVVPNASKYIDPADIDAEVEKARNMLKAGMTKGEVADYAEKKILKNPAVKNALKAAGIGGVGAGILWLFSEILGSEEVSTDQDIDPRSIKPEDMHPLTKLAKKVNEERDIAIESVMKGTKSDNPQIIFRPKKQVEESDLMSEK